MPRAAARVVAQSSLLVVVYQRASVWATLKARRSLLWMALVALVLALLGTLIWLAGRYELGRAQTALESDAQDAAADIRTALTRNVQSLQVLQNPLPEPAWSAEAALLLREHRELVSLERRSAAGGRVNFGNRP